MLRNKRSIFFLLIIILFCFINNYMWIKQYSFLPLRPDESDHLIESLKLLKILRTNLLGGLREWYSEFHTYPPLFTFSAAILNLVFSTSKIASTMTNTIYFIILIFSIYFLGKKIAGRNVGLLSAFMASMYPLIFGMQRWFMFELALTSMVAFSVCLLLYTDNFTNRKFSILFGISLGLGMLTKWTFPIFIIGPFLCILGKSLKKCKSSRFNLFFSITIGFFISLIYYNPLMIPVNSLQEIFLGKHQGYIPITLNQTSWQTLIGATFYLRSLFYQISPLFMLLFFITLPIFIRLNIKYKSILISWLFLPLIIFTFIPNKWARYIMPSLSSIAIISSLAILSFNWRKLKISIIGLIIMIGLAQYLLISYNRDISYHHSTFMWRYLDPPQTEIELSKIVNRLIPDYIIPYNSANNMINIGVVDTVPLMMEANALRYSVVEKDLNCRLISFPQELDVFLQQKDNLDYIITFRPADNNIWPTEKEIKQMLKIERLDRILGINENEYKLYTEIFSGLSKEFKVIKKISCADKFYFFLLKK